MYKKKWRTNRLKRETLTTLVVSTNSRGNAHEVHVKCENVKLGDISTLYFPTFSTDFTDWNNGNKN